MKQEFIKLLTWYMQQYTEIIEPEKQAKGLVSEYMDSIKKVDEAGTPKSITLFSNGNTAVLDRKGEQMGELQVNVDNFYFEFLELKGIDPTKISEIRKIVNGSDRTVVPFKTEDGDWNCHFLSKK